MNTPPRPLSAILTMAMLLTLFACAGEPARIKADDEADEVDVHGAGAATYDRLLAAVGKLLEPHKGEFAELKVRTIAFVDLENRTKEELADWRDLLIDKIESGVNQRRDFQVISVRYVAAVLKKMGSPPIDDLFIPEKQREFAKVIEQEKSPVQYLLFARLTSGTTQGARVRQGNYLLTLQLVNVQTGVMNTAQAEVRKEFAR